MKKLKSKIAADLRNDISDEQIFLDVKRSGVEVTAHKLRHVIRMEVMKLREEKRQELKNPKCKICKCSVDDKTIGGSNGRLNDSLRGECICLNCVCAEVLPC